MNPIKHILVLGVALAVQHGMAQDLTAFSNKLDQIIEENGERAEKAVEANKLILLNQALGRELGRPVQPTRDPAALRQAHQELVAAYVADIKRRVDAPETAWPAGLDAKAWKAAAGSLLDQATAYHREALAAGADLTSSLRMMEQVRAWTAGRSALAPGEDWTGPIEAEAENMAKGAPTGGTGSATGGGPAPQPASGGGASTTVPAGPTPPSTPVPAGPVQSPEQSPEPPARVPSALPAPQPEPAFPSPSSVSPPSSGRTTAPTPAAPAVTLTMVNSREKLGVRHNLATDSKAAWIGFYKTESGNKNYLSYAFLNNLTGGLYDVPRPEEPGSYQFRIFADEGFKPAAVSAPIEIK